MSATKLRKLPIAEQIAHYEKEIKRIQVHINNGKERIKELQRHIRILQLPNAEERHQRRLAQYENQQKRKNKPHLTKRMNKEERLNAIFDFINENY